MQGATGPTFAGLAGQPAVSPGGSQIGNAALRMGMEIDQALKLLAQTLPMLGPWVMETVQELHEQLGLALSAGPVTSPEPMDNERFPTGGGNL